MRKQSPETGEDTQGEEESSSKKNVLWHTEMDRCLTDALVEQMQRGNKIDNSFTSTAYSEVCDSIYVKLGVKVTASHVKNRLKTLRKDARVFHDMEISTGGFSFNKESAMIDAKPDVWDMYIKAHPKARQYRYKPVPCFENLRILFGEDQIQSTNLSSKPVKRKHVYIDKPDDDMKGCDHDPLEEIEIEIDGESGGESMNTSGMSKQAYHVPLVKSIRKMPSWKRLGDIDDLKEEFNMFRSGIDAVTSAIERCAPRVIPEEKLFEEVRKIEELDLDFQLLAYDYLCQDVIRGRTFIGLPVAFRKRWLELKLDQHVG